MKRFLKVLVNTLFVFRHRRHRSVRKIIYALTPSPGLRNVGDQAQALAIRKWFCKHFGDRPVLELNKDEVYRYALSLSKITGKDDLIFLHSGGNLGDKGLWSERARRLIVANLPDNRIISLPQTIFFSDSDTGKEELRRSRDIYSRHKDLVLLARDERSLSLAREYFPGCRVGLAPDFVLSLGSFPPQAPRGEKVLLCLRNDPESVLDETAKKAIEKPLGDLGRTCDYYDTTIARDIARERREEEFQRMLDIFGRYRLVITDRLHGIIFCVLTQTPCIALKTVDHKILASMKWFEELPYIFTAQGVGALSEIVPQALAVTDFSGKDWNALYFDKLPAQVLEGK